MNTPLAVDQYSRLMVDLFDERDVIGVSTGFQSIFGSKLNSSKTIFSPNSQLVEIDIIRGNEKTAALIQRGIQPTRDLNVKDVSDQSYSTFSRVYPLGEEESVITADQLLSRVAGENPYAGKDKLDRARVLAFNNHKEHIRRFVRMFELLAAQSALTGKMDAILGTSNANMQYDFRRSAENTVTVATAWDQGGATIMADIDAICRVVRKNGKITPDMAIIGGGAMEAMLDNAAFQAKADNRRFDLIEVSTNFPVPAKYQRYVNSGFIARGRLRTAAGYELWIFTYVDGIDAAGTYTEYMPTDKMLVMSSGARADRYFGPSEQMPMNAARLDMVSNQFGIQNPMTMANPKIKGDVVDASMFYFDAYPQQNFKGVVSRTQTAPIFATTMTDAFALLEGLTT